MAHSALPPVTWHPKVVLPTLESSLATINRAGRSRGIPYKKEKEDFLLDVELIGPTVPAGLTTISSLWRKPDLISGNCASKVPNRRVQWLLCGKGQASFVEEGMTPKGHQEYSWHLFFPDPTLWWDDRQRMETLRHPDCRHKKSKDAMWLSSPYAYWVDSHLSIWGAQSDAGTPVSLSVQDRSEGLGSDEGDLEVGTCRKLCEDGQVTEAVNSLSLLVDRRCHVPNNLFYRVLKRCIAQKDLALGRRIHTLTVESGYESDAFLATHLIGLYASHGKVKEAMGVFRKVPAPNAYMWASIMLAYANHGHPAKALGLYRQMLESSVKPDNRVFVAVLKACACVGNLAAGKDIHAHILASGVKPDIFVQTCLVDMYAKCGSLGDARRVFKRLSHRHVVTWNAMITGYAQQGRGQEALSLYSSMQEEGVTRPSSVTFISLLQACAGVGVPALGQGKQLHAEIKDHGLQGDVVVGASLVNMYAKCGSLEDARSVFDRLSQKNEVTWTAIIAGYAQQGMGQEALDLYSIMKQEGIIPPDAVTFVCLLQACACVGVAALAHGKQLEAQTKELGVHCDVVVGSSLVNMYAKCGSLEDAQRVFDRLLHKNVVTWTAMIAGYAQQGLGQEALSLYRRMQQEDITPPNSVTFLCLLQACASVGVAAMHHGQQLHAHIEGQGLQYDAAVCNSLINMYAKCGSVENAQRVFDSLTQKDVVTWTTMIAAYAQQGMGQEALHLFSSMELEGNPKPNSVTFVCLLQACAGVGVEALHRGKQLHAQIEDQGLQADVVVGNSLVTMYGKCGSLENARRVFDGLSQKNVVTWNAMIAGYVQHGMGHEALSVYSSMKQEAITLPDSVTFVCLMQACSSVGVGALHQGKQLHVQIEEQGLQADVVVGGSLIKMYVKCGSGEDAQRVFDRLPHKDVVTWTAMIAGYVQQGMGQQALRLYSSMQQEGITPPDSVTFVCLLQACGGVGVAALRQGKQLHVQIEEQGLQSDLVVGSSLINMYLKCGSVGDAQGVFDKLPHRDVVMWTALIAGYAQQGMSQQALSLYGSMQEEGITSPNSVTFACVQQACASVAALPLGKQIHAQIEEWGLQADVVVGPSLVNMYAKCGSLVEAQQVFDSLPEKDVVAWGALITGYARQGDSEIVFDLVHRMREDGVEPNSITFLSVLTMCSHVGLVDKGRRYFEAMSTDYGISPNIKHYTCMVDLLSRAGQLDEALEMVKTMPFPPNGAVWRTLLGACRKWNNLEVGLQAFELAVKFDEKDAAAYVLMSNIYAGAQMWEEAKEMQNRRVKFGGRKEPGRSWFTDMGGVLHSFVVGD